MNTKLPEGARIIGLDLAKKSFVGCILSGEGFVKKQIFHGTMNQDETGWQRLTYRIKADDLVLMEAGTSTFSLARFLDSHTADATKIACIARDMAEEAWPTVPVPTEDEQAERSSITSYVFIKKQETQIINRLYALFNSLGYPEISQAVLKDDQNARRDLAEQLIGTHPKALQEAHLLFDQLDLVQLQVEVRVQHLRDICIAHPQAALAWFSIPGIGIINAATLVAYVGDGSRFSNPHQLLNYAGLIPKQDQSGSVDKHLGIHKRGNNAIRRNIVQGAWIVSMMKPSCPITKYAYRKKKEGMIRQKVAIAVANKMLRTGLALLHSGKLYSPMIADGFTKLEAKLRSYKTETLMNHIYQD